MTILETFRKVIPIYLEKDKYRVSQKQVYKLIKHNSKLIALINDMYLFLDFTQSNLNFEPSFVGIHPGGGGLNLDRTGMCHRRLKFITLFWSGKTQKGYPALELPILP